MGIKIEKPRIQHWKPVDLTFESNSLTWKTKGLDSASWNFDVGNQGFLNWKLRDPMLENCFFISIPESSEPTKCHELTLVALSP